jgi:hypothetical protein
VYGPLLCPDLELCNNGAARRLGSPI